MHKPKANSILLYKESSTQADSRGLNISASKSRLINELKNTPHGSSTPRLKPKDYTLHNQSLKAFNMEDAQPRIKRDFSPLYQKSTQQGQLFEKGLKKPSVNINLNSKDNLSFNPTQSTNHQSTLSPRTIKRTDPNKQAQNLLELGSKPPLSSRSLNKRNPNVESEFREPKKQKSQIKDPNVESTRTADYVIKTLNSYPQVKPKEIHIKFTKKENILSAQNTTNQQINQNEQITKQHKRHFSHILLQANKQNIETKQNGICMKEDMTDKKKHERKEFNHDFYKKENRLKINTERDENHKKQRIINLKTVRNNEQTSNRAHLKTEHQQVYQKANRMAQLRKRLL